MDVTISEQILRPRSQVAAFVEDPLHDPEWIGGIRKARLVTPPPVGKGTRVRRVARFLGRQFGHVLEVADFQPGARIGMRSVSGPFPMEVTFSFGDDAGGTRMTIRVQGDAGRYYRVFGPLLACMVRRHVSKDLGRLKARLETQQA